MKRCTIVLLLATFIVSCQRGGSVIANVGSEKLTTAEFMDELKKAPDSYIEFLQSEQGRNQFLNVLVKEKIMITAARDMGLDRSRDYKNMLAEYKAELDKQLEDYKKNLLIERYYQFIKSGEISVSDNEIQNFYAENMERYKKPYRITLSHILLSDQTKAEEAYKRLQNGESFSALIAEFSAESWVNTESGKLEYTQPGSLSPELEEIALSLAIGQISKPVGSDNGFYILRKDYQSEQKPISIEDARQLIEAVIEKRKFDALMDDLTKKYNVKFNRELADKYFRQSVIDKAGEQK